jgi:hypothetical protein
MCDNDVIAVLVAGYDEEGAQRVTVVLRDAYGKVSMKQMTVEDRPAQQGDSTERFRRGKPILDPASREIVGYELERIRLDH